MFISSRIVGAYLPDVVKVKLFADLRFFWNFKHIVNVKTIRGIKAVTTYEGYKDLMIYPLSALLEEEEEGYGSDDLSDPDNPTEFPVSPCYIY